jgi:hypothetical protein
LSLVTRQLLPTVAGPHPLRPLSKSLGKALKGSKKGQKRRPHHIAIVASNGNNDEEADNSDEEFVAAAKCDFKR